MEDQFLEKEGVFLLLDLLEVSTVCAFLCLSKTVLYWIIWYYQLFK